MRKKIEILHTCPYSIWVGPGVSESAFIKEICSGLGEKTVIISDGNVSFHYRKKFEHFFADFNPIFLSIPAGDENKTRETKQLLEDQMLHAGCNRKTCVVALGGGMICDLAGFLASTYCRGVPVIYIPTTLLAMVDACVGGKTAVNTPFGKNMIGAFTHPRAVIADTNMLSTLSRHELECGLAEMLKHALIRDRAYFFSLCAQFQKYSKVTEGEHWLLKEKEWLISAITRSIEIKNEIVGQDERDGGVRQLLNFGHTIGHAIEQLSDYKISHGQAVAIGLRIESYLSLEIGLLPRDEFSKIAESLGMFSFSLKTNLLDDFAKLRRVLLLDKKASSDRVNCVLLEGIGRSYKNIIYPLKVSQIQRALSLM